MVNKMEVAQAFDMSPGMLVDSMRHFHIFGTIDDGAVLITGGTATVAVFRAPFACKLVEAIIRVNVAEEAGGTIDLCREASGDAIDGHESSRIVTQISAPDLTPHTDYPATLEPMTLVAGDTVAWYITTVGEMTGLMYALKFERLN